MEFYKAVYRDISFDSFIVMITGLFYIFIKLKQKHCIDNQLKQLKEISGRFPTSVDDFYLKENYVLFYRILSAIFFSNYRYYLDL
jgi:hypothetical protein